MKNVIIPVLLLIIANALPCFVFSADMSNKSFRLRSLPKHKFSFIDRDSMFDHEYDEKIRYFPLNDGDILVYWKEKGPQFSLWQENDSFRKDLYDRLHLSEVATKDLPSLKHKGKEFEVGYEFPQQGNVRFGFNFNIDTDKESPASFSELSPSAGFSISWGD